MELHEIDARARFPRIFASCSTEPLDSCRSDQRTMYEYGGYRGRLLVALVEGCIFLDQGVKVAISKEVMNRRSCTDEWLTSRLHCVKF